MSLSTSSSDAEFSEVRIVCGSPEATLELARRIGGQLEGGEVLALVGELGAGKTLFVRGVVGAIGGGCAHRVSSPTYVLELVYPGELTVHHYDAYRLRGPEELVELGFDEQVRKDTVVVVEWADRVWAALPESVLEITFEHRGAGRSSERTVRLRAAGARWRAVMAGLRAAR